jgi:hypothetical protein
LICTVIALQSMVVRSETYTCSLADGENVGNPSLIKLMRQDYLEDREDETGKVHRRTKTFWKFTSSWVDTYHYINQTVKSDETIFLTGRISSPEETGFMLTVFLDPVSLKVRVHFLKHPESSTDDTLFTGNCMFEESPINWVPEARDFEEFGLPVPEGIN